jgi:signal transduction histidine kinase
MPLFTASEPEELLARLVHDLRQPLGTIETSAYYMNLLLGQEQAPARQQLRIVERQVDLAARMLNEAAAELRHLRSQRADAAPQNRDATKPETAAVT